MRRVIMLLSLLVAATTAHAQVNALPATRHILVYGDAEARAIPDRFKIKVAFDAVDRDAGKARDRVERNVASVVQRLGQAGVGEGDIVATSLSIEPLHRTDPKTDEEIFVGTEVERSLTATFADKSALERFLSGLQTSDELSVSDVSTAFSNEAALRRALRQKAIEATREKAQAMAEAYGARLGALYGVSDVAPQFSYGVAAGGWPAGYEWSSDSNSLDRVTVTGARLRSGTALTTGYVTFTDRIYAVFLLAD